MNWILLLGFLGFPQDGTLSAGIDYSKVDRRIGRQPAYVAEPAYAIFLMDSAGRRPVWGVLDKSEPTSAVHNVLYLDLNGNGDLVDEGERIVALGKDDHPAEGKYPPWAVIRIGDVKVPGAGMTHTKVHVQTVLRPKGLRASFDLTWEGKVNLSGGIGRYDQDAKWGESPAEAPVFHPFPHGVLRFCLWDSFDDKNEVNDGVLAVGKRNRVRLLVGNAGWGKVSFSAVHETFLDLKRDVLRMTLIYRDRDGKECREGVQVKEHC